MSYEIYIINYISSINRYLINNNNKVNGFIKSCNFIFLPIYEKIHIIYANYIICATFI